MLDKLSSILEQTFRLSQLLSLCPLPDLLLRIDEAATCDFDVGSCGWNSGQWRRATRSDDNELGGFLYNDQLQESGIFTNLRSPSIRFDQLMFMYRLVEMSSRCKLELRCLTTTPTLNSFTWLTVWSTRQCNHGGWRQAKVIVPAYTVALMFTSAEAEVSIDGVVGGEHGYAHFAQLALGYAHSCAILASVAELRCWGHGHDGQLGQGNQENIGDEAGEMGYNLKAIDLGTNRTAKQIATGSYHTCAVLDNDNVKCWGHGGSGQLGQGNTWSVGGEEGSMGDNLKAIDSGTNRTAKQVATNPRGYHVCALLDNDNVKCWGYAYDGQLGQGSYANDIGDEAGEMGDNLKAIDLGTNRTAKQIATGAYQC